MRRCLNCMSVYEKEYNVCPHCGYVHNTKPAMDKFLLPGAVLNDRYIIGTVIGSGGFGITYVAWDKLLQKKIAIKEYFPATIAGRTGESSFVNVFGDEEGRQYRAGLTRFLDEARRIAKFNEAENIVHVYDFLESNNTAYMVMEFIPGKTLKTIILEKEKFSIDEAVKIVSKVASILEKVHEFGIIHRDISPDNIMLLENGDVKLLDFGAARFFAERENKQLSIILKPSYSPPEQYVRENKQDKRTDVYALGAVLYHMITGQKPNESAARLLGEELKNPNSVDSTIPAWLDACVMKAMSLSAEDRFKDMTEFNDALSNKETPLSQWVYKIDQLKERFLENKKRNTAIVTVGTILIIAILIAIGIVSGNNNSSTQTAKTEETKVEKEERLDAEVKSLNETEALRDAIENAVYGDTIYIEPGQYNFGGPLDVYADNIKIIGKTDGGEVIFDSGIYIHSSNVTIENIALDIKSEQNAADESNGIHLEGGGTTKLKNVDVVMLYNSEYILYGMTLYSSAELEGCNVDVNDDDGGCNVSISVGEGIKATDCVISSNDVGIIFLRGGSETVINDILENNKFYCPTKIMNQASY